MKHICILAERPQGIIERLTFRRGYQISNSQLPYYLPEKDSVSETWRAMKKVASDSDNDVHLLWVDTADDVTKAIGQVNEHAIFWPLTDGYWPFVGTPIIGLLKSLGGSVFGSGVVASAVSQNKYIQYALFRAIGLPTPDTWCQGTWESPPDSMGEYIVKPIDLGNSIGIFDDGIACDWPTAMIVAGRITAVYGRQAIIQRYVDGLYCRASFVGKNPVDEDIGVHVFPEGHNESVPEEWTSFEAYFEVFKKRDALCNTDVNLVSLDRAVDRGMVSLAARDLLMKSLSILTRSIDLAGLFTIDIIVKDDTPYFIEINTNPFLRNVALQAHCWERWNCDLISALHMAMTS